MRFKLFFGVIILNGILCIAQTQDKSQVENLSGKWVGILHQSSKQGDAEIEIKYANGVYTAKFTGFPMFSGYLYNIHVQSGIQPNTTTIKMVSKTYEESILRFYLVKKSDEPQLYGIAKLDLPSGEDVNYNVILEAQPCCDPKCKHIGKSRCY